MANGAAFGALLAGGRRAGRARSSSDRDTRVAVSIETSAGREAGSRGARDG